MNRVVPGETQDEYTLMIVIYPHNAGLTMPSEGIYTYPADTLVDVVWIHGQYSMLDHWELNGTNVGEGNEPYEASITVMMNASYILTCVYYLIEPFNVLSITPLAAAVEPDSSVNFVANVTGGLKPYSFQWYVNNTRIAMEPTGNWNFTPATEGLYSVFFKAKDTWSSAVDWKQSDTAWITVKSATQDMIVVPDDFASIQDAINNAADGDTIFVRSGTYYEHVIVNKPIALIGEDPTTTIIDGNGTGHVIHVVRSHVNITEFTVENGGKRGLPALDAGICLDNVTYCAISRNEIINAGFLGISLLYSEQNTIACNNVTGSGWNGIHLWGSSRNAISGNILYNNTDVGINCHSSSNCNNITGNVISKVTHGIYWFDANHNALYHNNISMNQIGVYIENSTQNKIYGNNLVNNKKQAEIVGGTANTWDDGYSFGGNYWSDYNGTDANHDGRGDAPYIVDTNNIDRYPLINPFSGIVVPDQYPTIQAAINHANDGDTVFVRAGTYYEHVVVNRTVALVGEDRDTTIIDGSYVGIVVNITRDGVNISSFTIRRSGTTWNIGGPPYGAGIYMRNVTDCTISRNKITQDAAGIQLEFGADGNVIVDNTVTSVDLGFGTFDASWNSFTCNNITSNGRGLGLNVDSNCNVIASNRITALEWVIALHACHYNNITDNYVANGQIGVYLPDSSYNRVYHNQIVNNIQQASFYGFTPLPNYWDDGYPSGGNYWSDYYGSDQFRGPYQNATGTDGIGDTAYLIDNSNVDRFPLMVPYIPSGIWPDLNADGLINILDIVIVAGAFGSTQSNPNWNSMADINRDGIVDILDIVTVALHFGETG